MKSWEKTSVFSKNIIILSDFAREGRKNVIHFVLRSVFIIFASKFNTY